MTKADIVNNISDQLGIDKTDVQATLENFMKEKINQIEQFGEDFKLRCIYD